MKRKLDCSIDSFWFVGLLVWFVGGPGGFRKGPGSPPKPQRMVLEGLPGVSGALGARAKKYNLAAGPDQAAEYCVACVASDKEVFEEEVENLKEEAFQEASCVSESSASCNL